MSRRTPTPATGWMSQAPRPRHRRAPPGEARARARGAALRQDAARRAVPGRRHHVHRTLRAALNEAVRRCTWLATRCCWPRRRCWTRRKWSPTASTRSSGSWTWPPNGATAPGGRSPWRSACGRARRSALQWEDVDLDKGRPHPPLPAAAQVRAWLRRHLRPEARLLPAARQHPRRYRRSQVEGRPPHDRPAAPARRAASRAPGRAGRRTGAARASCGRTRAGCSPARPASC